MGQGRIPVPHRPGFTLVEVLMVIGLMGLAAAIVVPHMLRAGTLGVQAAARMVIADILFAQNEAIAQQTVRRVVFDEANESYRLTDGAGTAIGVNWKSGGGTANYVVDFANDQRFQSVELDNVDFGGTAVLEFDPIGTPNSGGVVELVFDNVRYRITVAEFTGRVTVAQL